MATAAPSIAALRSALADRLPEHTFTAVMRRAGALGSEQERRELLAGVLAERKRSEGEAP